MNTNIWDRTIAVPDIFYHFLLYMIHTSKQNLNLHFRGPELILK